MKTGKEHYTIQYKLHSTVRRLLRFHYYMRFGSSLFVVSPCLLHPAHNQELMKLSKIYLFFHPTKCIHYFHRCYFIDSQKQKSHRIQHFLQDTKIENAAHSKNHFRNNTLEPTKTKKTAKSRKKMPSFFLNFSYNFSSISVLNSPRRLPTSHKFANKFHQRTNSTEQPKIVKSNEKNWFFPFWCSAFRRGGRRWICSRVRTTASILLNSIFRFYFH